MIETWFLIALLAPFLWAISNFVDKILLENLRPTHEPVGVLILFSSLVSFFFIPCIYWYVGGDIAVSLSSKFLLIGAGCLEMFAIALYLLVLEKEETSSVIPLFQIIPFFSFLLGYFILGEVLTASQVFAGMGIIIGGILISLDFKAEEGVRLKKRVLILALVSSLAFSGFDVLFKSGAAGIDFATALFWQHIGIAGVGVVLFLAFKKYREALLRCFSRRSLGFFGVNLANEGLYFAGIAFFSYALLLAPIALVASVTVYQPVFVFLLAIPLSVFAPKLIQEDLSHGHLLRKGIAIAIILLASLWLVAA